MKKQTIWILTILMALTFVGLISLQIIYMRNIVEIRYEQFTQGVRQSLLSVAIKLEQDETKFFLEDGVNRVESQSINAQRLGTSLPIQEGIKYSFSTTSGLEADLTIKGNASEITKLQSGGSIIGGGLQNVQDNYRDHYLYQKGMLDDVILNIMSKAYTRPIIQRADSALVRNYLRQEFDTLGIKIPFEYAVVNRAGIVQYRSPGYNPSTEQYDDIFTQTLFPRDPSASHYYLKVYFPSNKDYIFKSISFLVPALALTFIFLIIFVYTVIIAFRQKKL
ncbi:MAG: two-component sensor histidine kinase, partial [Muribaculaceae bacterium]|nr:two-component sensor histidine kinase [Muribaculaceae bacterium]